ncbi:MAG: class I SAM-dependent methyltransferase [Syntrophaceae bacterium]
MQTALLAILGISLIAFAVLFIFSMVIVAVHHRTGGAMFVPTPGVMIRRLTDAVDFARFKSIRELGTGDGRFLASIEKRYGVSATGYEINPIAYLMTRLRIKLLGLKSRVFFRDFWHEDFSAVDCIYCYLFVDIMPRLGEKLESELPEGAMVFSANFPIPGWREEEIIKATETIFNDPIFVYRIGVHKDSVEEPCPRLAGQAHVR